MSVARVRTYVCMYVCMYQYVHVYVYFTMLKNEFLLDNYDVRIEKSDSLPSYCLMLDVLFG